MGLFWKRKPHFIAELHVHKTDIYICGDFGRLYYSLILPLPEIANFGIKYFILISSNITLMGIV